MPLRHISDPLREQVSRASGRVTITAHGDGTLDVKPYSAV